jgi:uncharacterized protein involved in exopolysaccharide biosynthesis
MSKKDQFPAPIHDAEPRGVATLIGGLRDESRFSLVEVVAVIFRHWKKAATVAAALFALVCFYTFYVVKDTYTSEARVLIRAARTNLAVDPANPRGVSGEFMPTLREQALNETSIIESRTLIETVVDEIGPENIIDMVPAGAVEAATDPSFPVVTDEDKQRARAVQTVMAGLSTVPNKGNVISIYYTGYDSEMTHRILDTLTNKYIERHMKIYEPSASPEFFGTELDRLGEKLREKEAELRAYAGKSDLGDTEAQRLSFASRQRALQEELSAARTQKNAIEARIRSYEEAIATRDREVQVTRSTAVNEEFRELDNRLLELELEESALANKYFDDNPELRRVRDQIALIRERLENQPKNDEEITTALDTTRERLEQMLLEQRAEMKAAAASEVALAAELEGINDRMRELASIEPEAFRLRREITLLQETYNEMQENQQRAIVSSALDRNKTSNVSVIQAATKPFGPDDAQRQRNILFGAFTAVMAGLLLAFVVEYLDDSMKTSTDVERRLELPVLATIAFEKSL